jgi:hypothetical protein
VFDQSGDSRWRGRAQKIYDQIRAVAPIRYYSPDEGPSNEHKASNHGDGAIGFD